MNVYLFLEALTEQEREGLRSFFIKTEQAKSNQAELSGAEITIEELLNKYGGKYFSVRLNNVLKRNLHHETAVFKKVGDINRADFLKIRNAGLATWVEMRDFLYDEFKIVAK